MTNDIHIYVVDLPTRIREMVTPCFCGYSIYLNSRLTREGMEQAYRHALSHIENNDWEREEDVNVIEYERHRS